MVSIISKIIICLFLTTFCFADEIDDLIPFIIQVESGGNPYAMSEDGCIGLMQISPIVLREFNQTFNMQEEKTTLFKPNNNKFIGTWYLRRLKDHYLKDNYTIERLLSAWNGGITRLRKLNYDCSKMPRETRNFVKKVMKLYRR